ncbi:MAG: hypothetical protein ACHQJ6_01980 [Candidatus Berkiellales bacterium]
MRKLTNLEIKTVHGGAAEIDGSKICIHELNSEGVENIYFASAILLKSSESSDPSIRTLGVVTAAILLDRTERIRKGLPCYQKNILPTFA